MSSNNQTQTTGPGTITSDNADTRTLNHRGTEVGSSNVTLSNNVANRNDVVIAWTVPKKYKRLSIAGGRHWTKAEIRTTETLTGTSGDDTVVNLNTNIAPISGEKDLSDQPFPAVVAYNVDTSTQYDIADIDYEQNTVTLGTNPSNGETVKLWPVMTDGVVQYRASNAFENFIGPLDEWGVPLHVFADFDQEKNQTQIYLPGAARFDKDEVLELYLDAPQVVTWEDSDYPEGEFVSKVEQRVDIVV